MDIGRRGTNRSLRMQLALWIVGLMVVVGSIATVASYRFALGEAHALQDDTLRQIGALVRQLPPSDLKVLASIHAVPAIADASVAIIPLKTHDPGGECGFSHGMKIPCGLKDGLHALHSRGEGWRVWIGSLPSGARYAVAQATALRDEIARDGSLRTLVPMLCLIGVLIPFVTWVIRRMLRPIVQLAETLDDVDERSIAGLPQTDMPLEIAPFVASINRLLARLKHALEQQGRFVADAAHELRSPLTALTLQAQNMEKFPMEPGMRERFEALQSGLGRSTRLVTQLLSLARLHQEGPRAQENLQVGDEVHAAVEEAYPLAEAKGIDLGVERLEATAIKGNRLALHTALRNLLDNAIRYTPAHGRVDLRVYRDGDCVCIEVRDNGPGMPPESLKRACEPFFRGSDGAEPGSGLGLAIVRDMARDLAGELSLSSPGVGLLARIRLPVAPASPGS